MSFIYKRLPDKKGYEVYQINTKNFWKLWLLIVIVGFISILTYFATILLIILFAFLFFEGIIISLKGAKNIFTGTNIITGSFFNTKNPYTIKIKK